MSSNLVKKIYVVSKQKFGGHQRKIAFFKKQPEGLYFDLGSFYMGSHTSYHVDGNIFRTSPATENRARPRGTHLPLDNFKGWYQLGTSMITKKSIANKPIIRQRDRKKDIYILEIDLDLFPADTINLVVELLEPGKKDLLAIPSLAPPPGSREYIIDKINPWLVLTVLGHNENLLIRPIEDGVSVNHKNTRFSANQRGVNYTCETYKL